MRDKEFYERYTNKILRQTTSEQADEDAVNTRLQMSSKKNISEVISEESEASKGCNTDNVEKKIEGQEKQEIQKTDEMTDSKAEIGENEEVNLSKKWFVVQTVSGKEEVLMKYINVFVDKSYVEECFVPKRERKKKVNKQWKVITEKIFKGYVFIVTSYSEKVFFSLKNIPMLSKILCDGEFTFIPLKDNEINFISRLGSGRPDHTAKISTVEFGKGDEVIYMQGDVIAFEGMIKKFDKHKRRAIVETEMFGQKTEIWLEFEYLRKKGT